MLRLILVHQMYTTECTCQIYVESCQEKLTVCDALVYEGIMVSEVIRAFGELLLWEIILRLVLVCKGKFFGRRRHSRV